MDAICAPIVGVLLPTVPWRIACKPAMLNRAVNALLASTRRGSKLRGFEENAVSNVQMLTAREVYQILRDASLASRTMRRVSSVSWNEIYCGLMTVDVDGWVITLFNDCGDLDYCDSCYSPDNRKYDFSSTDPHALDPVELLGPDEHRRLEEMLRLI